MAEFLFEVAACYAAMQLGRWLERRRIRALSQSQAHRERFLNGDWS